MKPINYKKIALFLILTFVISWTVALIMYQLKINITSTKGVLLIIGPIMFSPAIATIIVQKFIYKENLKKYGWTFNKKGLRWSLKIPLIFISMILLTFLTILILGNLFHIDSFGLINFSQENFNLAMSKILEEKNVTVEIPELPSKLMFIGFLMQGTILGGLINLPIMFGEEFGWRGLLLYETKKLGFIKSSLFIGFFWGIWHTPIIMMGHNYPNYPYIGILVMCIMTIFLSPIFTYVRIKSQSIFGACLLHGMINGTATIFIFYVVGGNELFNSIAGFAGVIANTIIVFCIYYFDKKFIKNFQNENIL